MPDKHPRLADWIANMVEASATEYNISGNPATETRFKGNTNGGSSWTIHYGPESEHYPVISVTLHGNDLLDVEDEIIYGKGAD